MLPKVQKQKPLEANTINERGSVAQCAGVTAEEWDKNGVRGSGESQYLPLFQIISINSKMDHHKLGVSPFIRNTYEILESAEHSDIVSWINCGRLFEIKKQADFENVVLPKYFKHKKLNSFIRQLYMYGFHKKRNESSRIIFSHPNFLQDKFDMLPQIKRKITGKNDQFASNKYDQHSQGLYPSDAQENISILSDDQLGRSIAPSFQKISPCKTGKINSGSLLNLSFMSLNFGENLRQKSRLIMSRSFIQDNGEDPEQRCGDNEDSFISIEQQIDRTRSGSAGFLLASSQLHLN